MLVATAAVLSLIAFGVPVALTMHRAARGAYLFALSFLYGSGVIWASMFALSLAGVRWSALSITCAAAAITVPLLLLHLRRGRVSTEAALPPGHSRASIAVDAATLSVLVVFACYAVAAPVWQWDFWAIWGLKARVFVERGGIDVAWLTNIWNGFAHLDYPLLVPMEFAYVAELGGAWSDRWLGLLTVASGAATLAFVREVARRDVPPPAASAIALAATIFALTPHVGLADAPLIAFATGAVLLTERAIRGDVESFLPAGVLLGLAANTKNEGVALVAAVFAAVAIESFASRRFRLRQALPLLVAPLLALPWWIFRAAHHLQTDIAEGSALDRGIARLAEVRGFVTTLALRLEQPVLWILLAAAVLVALPATWRTARFLLVVVVLQTAAYVATYFVTPHDPVWHIATSWGRLTAHVGPLALFAVMRMLALTFTDAKESALHAEAGQEL